MPDKLGILTLDPAGQQDYFEQIAQYSQKYDVELYLFSPLEVIPGTQMAKGLKFNAPDGEWKEGAFPIPDCLYDRCFYGEDQFSKDAKKIVSWLKERMDITFLGYGLPNKGILYDRLKFDSRISPYLPETVKATGSDDVLRELNKYLSVILKPANGAHGYAVYSLEKRNDAITVKTTKNGNLVSKDFISLDTFESWLLTLLSKHNFLIQAKLGNTDRKNRPFDLRVFLQKDRNGHWREVARGIRTGVENGILTNMSAGAVVSTFETWQRQTPYFNHAYIEQGIADLMKQLPLALEEAFHPLFELGVDIIIAHDQSIWILDINSKPGRKMIGLLYPEKLGQMYEAPLAYCRFLQETAIGKEGSSQTAPAGK
ncbi:endospore coat-associated protein YheC [Weizmannia acidilactici]|uniref:YheC/YheD family endospore coat-associated protein n=1 Tax=Weizmannia acidilactici TaxID=2607726 RepID=UPI00124E157A|nr:YheC/YheD family protein [Weizmannia acidilactici]GER65823.1 endospore coat-associated protein YheC [Weizmannia acidilactici]